MSGRHIEVVPLKKGPEGSSTFERHIEIYPAKAKEAPKAQAPQESTTPIQPPQMGEAVAGLLQRNIHASLMNAACFHHTPLTLEKGKVANPSFTAHYEKAKAYDGMVYAIAERHPEATKNIIALIKESAKMHTKTTDQATNQEIARHASRMIQRIKKRNFPTLES